MLSVSCAHLLEFLEQEPVPFEVLQDRLQSFLGDADGQEVSDLAHEIVDTLSKIGIIETLEEAS